MDNGDEWDGQMNVLQRNAERNWRINKVKETKCEMEGILYEKSQNLYCTKSQTFGIFFQKKNRLCFARDGNQIPSFR